MRRVVWIAGGLFAGGSAIHFVSPPVIGLGVFIGGSYFLVRVALAMGRWAWARISEFKRLTPDLSMITGRRRIAEIMALADERILELKEELAASHARVSELEAE